MVIINFANKQIKIIIPKKKKKNWNSLSGEKKSGKNTDWQKKVGGKFLREKI